MTSRKTRRPRRGDSPPPKTGPEERDVLLGFLDYLRSSISAKAEGAPEPDVRTPGVASGTNLLGLIKHLTYVERYTFLGEDVANWPATFHAGTDETVQEVLSGYRDAIDQANEQIAACTDLNGARATDHPAYERTLAAVGPGPHDRRDRPPRRPRRHPA